jgi:hypothetical protein
MIHHTSFVLRLGPWFRIRPGPGLRIRLRIKVNPRLRLRRRRRIILPVPPAPPARAGPPVRIVPIEVARRSLPGYVPPFVPAAGAPTLCEGDWIIYVDGGEAHVGVLRAVIPQLPQLHIRAFGSHYRSCYPEWIKDGAERKFSRMCPSGGPWTAVDWIILRNQVFWNNPRLVFSYRLPMAAAIALTELRRALA